MDIAIGLPVAVPGAAAPALVDWARRAESAGFSSLGTIGRIVFDSHEELIALAAAAGATRRIGLVTTVLIGPVREPVLLAKQAATLDALSEGRLTLGLGIGWRDDDFAATGADYDTRGRELEHQIAVLRRVFAGEAPAPGLGRVGPPPARSGGPPIAIGGMAPPALRRAGRLGDAFLAPPGTPVRVKEMFEVVLEARRRSGKTGRPRLLGAAYFALGDPEAGRRCMADYYAFGGPDFVRTMQEGLLTSPEAVREAVEGLEKVGVDEMFLWPATADPDEVERLAKVAL